MLMDWKPWLYGLTHSFISGGINSIAVMIADPSQFSFATWKDAEHLGSVFLTGSVIGLVLYLKQSPLPPDPKLTITTTVTEAGTTETTKQP
jgi:hypothetical protein